MREFIYTGQPARVIFGAGSLQHLERELVRLGAQRALVLCSPQQQEVAEQIAQLLGARAVGIYPQAVMHVPAETAAAAVAHAQRLGADRPLPEQARTPAGRLRARRHRRCARAAAGRPLAA